MSGIITGTRNPSPFQKSHVIGKVPVGHVVQTQGIVDNASLNDGSPNTMTEIKTGFRVTITPTSTRNKLFMSFATSTNNGGTSGIEVYEFYDVTGSATVEPRGIADGNRNRAHWAHRGSHHNTNDCSEICFYLFADVARTTETVYTINRKAADASADRNFNFTNSDNAAWGFTATTTFFIQEIQTY